MAKLKFTFFQTCSVSPSVSVLLIIQAVPQFHELSNDSVQQCCPHLTFLHATIILSAPPSPPSSNKMVITMTVTNTHLAITVSQVQL